MHTAASHSGTYLLSPIYLSPVCTQPFVNIHLNRYKYSYTAQRVLSIGGIIAVCSVGTWVSLHTLIIKQRSHSLRGRNSILLLISNVLVADV